MMTAIVATVMVMARNRNSVRDAANADVVDGLSLNVSKAVTTTKVSGELSGALYVLQSRPLLHLWKKSRSLTPQRPRVEGKLQSRQQVWLQKRVIVLVMQISDEKDRRGAADESWTCASLSQETILITIGT